MKFERYKIHEDTEIEIINKDSRYFRKSGKLGAENPGHLGCNVEFENGEFDTFCWDEFLPVQNILALDDLKIETLSKVFDQNYLYETNRVVVYLGKFTTEDIEMAYKELAKQLYMGECGCPKAEYVLALLNEMRGYDADDLEIPIGEMIEFVQWWVEGLRNHATNKMKDRRYFEMEHLQIDFVELD